MTIQRFDDNSTEFGLWLRAQPEIDSDLGYRATNIDYCWQYRHTGEWMFIEEKRYNAKPKFWQVIIFQMITKLCMHDNLFKGFFYITFENTSPEDGKIYLNNEEITKEYLLNFLQFKT